MLRGRYGWGWMIVAWLLLAVVLVLTIIGAMTVSSWLPAPPAFSDLGRQQPAERTAVSGIPTRIGRTVAGLAVGQPVSCPWRWPIGGRDCVAQCCNLAASSRTPVSVGQADTGLSS